MAYMSSEFDSHIYNQKTKCGLIGKPLALGARYRGGSSPLT